MNTEAGEKQSAPMRRLSMSRKIRIPLLLISTCLLCSSAVNFYISRAGDSRTPTWSPDGRYIAYEFNNLLGSQIAVMEADGSHRRIVAECDDAQSPAWSPDSTKIAINCITGYGPLYGQVKFSIVLVEADGSGQTELIHGEFSNHSHQWSPDGEALVFVSSRDAGDPDPLELINWDIYLYSVLDGTIFRLTSDHYPDINPAWSPDGSAIAYVSDLCGDGGTPVTVSDAPDCDGAIMIRTREGDLQGVMRGSGTALSWSPDGSLIAFSNGQRVFYLDVINGTRTELTPPDRKYYPHGAVISPDGTRVVFAGKPSLNAGYELYITDITDGSTFQLTSNDIGGFAPAWSPDGLRIAFHSRPDRRSHVHIFTIAPDGSGLNCLTCMPWE